jgi:hypothetical protein
MLFTLLYRDKMSGDPWVHVNAEGFLPEQAIGGF